MKQCKFGFTLLEISIVLLIIGLLLGGVFVGQELIKGAQARRVVAQAFEIEQGYNTFKEKFGFVPGDNTVATASANFGSDALGLGGDGNGFIGQTAITEHLSFYYYMAKTRLYSGPFSANVTQYIPGVNMPSAPETGMGAVPYSLSSQGGEVVLYYGVQPGSSTVWGNSMSPDFANRIDSKIDDGIANTGRVQAHSAPGVAPILNDTPKAFGCVITNPRNNDPDISSNPTTFTLYKLDTDSTACQISIELVSTKENL